MTNLVQKFGEIIIENQNTLTNRLTALRRQSTSDDIQFLQSEIDEAGHEEKARLLRSEFFNYIGDALISGDLSQTFDLITKWGHRAGALALKHDIPMESIIENIGFFRQVLYEFIQEEATDKALTIEDIFNLSSIINPLIDHCMLSLSLEYIKSSQETIDIANKSIKELSAPVIPIANDIGILPILAELNSYRTKIIREKLLKRVTELQLNYLIIDLSGLVRIDNLGVNRIYEIVKTLKLLGVNTFITGIPPKVAQTMVNLGINITNVPVLGTLQQALQSLGIKNDAI